MDLATLGIGVETPNLDAAVQKLEDLAASGEKVTKSVRESKEALDAYNSSLGGIASLHGTSFGDDFVAAVQRAQESVKLLAERLASAKTSSTEFLAPQKGMAQDFARELASAEEAVNRFSAAITNSSRLTWGSNFSGRFAQSIRTDIQNLTHDLGMLQKNLPANEFRQFAEEGARRMQTLNAELARSVGLTHEYVKAFAQMPMQYTNPGTPHYAMLAQPSYTQAQTPHYAMLAQPLYSYGRSTNNYAMYAQSAYGYSNSDYIDQPGFLQRLKLNLFGNEGGTTKGMLGGITEAFSDFHMGVIKTGGVIWAVRQVIDLFREAADAMMRLLRPLDEFKQTTYAIGGTLTDTFGGRAPQGTYAQNKAYAGNVVPLLERSAARYGISSEAVQQAMMLSATQGMAPRGTTMKGLSESVDDMALAIAKIKQLTIGQPNQNIQLASELRAMATGRDRPGDAFANMMKSQFGSNWDTILKEQMQSGDVWKFLAENLKGTSESLSDTSRTLEASLSRISVGFMQITRTIVEPLYQLAAVILGPLANAVEKAAAYRTGTVTSRLDNAMGGAAYGFTQGGLLGAIRYGVEGALTYDSAGNTSPTSRVMETYDEKRMAKNGIHATAPGDVLQKTLRDAQKGVDDINSFLNKADEYTSQESMENAWNALHVARDTMVQAYRKYMETEDSAIRTIHGLSRPSGGHVSWEDASTRIQEQHDDAVRRLENMRDFGTPKEASAAKKALEKMPEVLRKDMEQAFTQEWDYGISKYNKSASYQARLDAMPWQAAAMYSNAGGSPLLASLFGKQATWIGKDRSLEAAGLSAHEDTSAERALAAEAKRADMEKEIYQYLEKQQSTYGSMMSSLAALSGSPDMKARAEILKAEIQYGPIKQQQLEKEIADLRQSLATKASELGLTDKEVAQINNIIQLKERELSMAKDILGLESKRAEIAAQITKANAAAVEALNAGQTGTSHLMRAESLALQMKQPGIDPEKMAQLQAQYRQEKAMGTMNVPELMDLGRIKAANQAYDEFANRLSMVIPNSFDAMSAAATGAITDIVTGAKKAGDAVKDMAKAIGNSIVRMLMDIFTSGMKSQLLSAFGLGGGGTSGGLGAIFGAAGGGSAAVSAISGTSGGGGSSDIKSAFSSILGGTFTPDIFGVLSGGTTETRQRGGSRWENAKGFLLQAAAATGVDPGILAQIAGAESNYNPSAVNPRQGHAGGLFQFIDSSWASAKANWGDEFGIDATASKTDPRANSLLGAMYIKSNMAAYRKAFGSDASATDVYAMHFLGNKGGLDFLRAFHNDPSAPISSIVSRGAIDNNPEWLGGGKSVGDVYKKLEGVLAPYAGNANAIRSNTQYGILGPQVAQAMSSNAVQWSLMGALIGPAGASALTSSLRGKSVMELYTGLSASDLTSSSAAGSSNVWDHVSLSMMNQGTTGNTLSNGVWDRLAVTGLGGGGISAPTIVKDSNGNMIAVLSGNGSGVTTEQIQQAQAQTTSNSSLSGDSLKDLVTGKSSSWTDSLNRWGYDNLGIGTEVPNSWVLNGEQASAYDWLTSPTGGQWNESAAWEAVAKNGGTSITGGLGSMIGSAVSGAGMGMGISSLIYPNGTGTVGGTIGGALGGLAGSALGSSVGGVLGSALGPVGSILGGVIGSLFGGGETTTTKKTGSGITVSIVGGKTSYSGWDSYSKTTSGAFGSSSTSHYKTPTIGDPELESQFTQAMDQFTVSIKNMSKALNMSTAVLKDFTFPYDFDINSDNLTGAAKNVANFMAYLEISADGVKDAFDDTAKSGEVYIDQLKRIGTGYQTISGAMAVLGQSIESASGYTDKIYGGDWASRMAENFGGESTAATLLSYYGKYGMSEADRTQAGLTGSASMAGQAFAQIGDSGLTMENFWEKYSAAMSSGNLSTDQAANWLSAANWVAQFDQYEQQAVTTMTDINNLRIAQLQQEISVIQDAKVMVDGVLTSVQSAYSSYSSLNDSLISSIQGITWNSSLSGQTPSTTFKQQQAYYNKLLYAVNNGDESSVSYSSDVQKLSSFASTYLTTAKSYLGGSSAYYSIEKSVVASLSKLQSKTQSTVDVLKQQLQKQDEQLNTLNTQLDQLQQVNNYLNIVGQSISVLGMNSADGFNNVSTLLSQVVSALGGSASGVSSLVWNADFASAYAAAASSYASASASLAVGSNATEASVLGISYDSLSSLLGGTNATGYALGGNFGPGGFFTGENGPEWVSTNMSGHVTSNSSLKDIFDTTDLHTAAQQGNTIMAYGFAAMQESMQEMAANVGSLASAISAANNAPSRTRQKKA